MKNERRDQARSTFGSLNFRQDSVSPSIVNTSQKWRETAKETIVRNTMRNVEQVMLIRRLSYKEEKK